MQLPKGLTKKQFIVISLMSPAPLGEGLTQREAAVKLGISRLAVRKRLDNFKKNFLQEYYIFVLMRKSAKRFKKNLKACFQGSDKHHKSRYNKKDNVPFLYSQIDMEYLTSGRNTLRYNFEEYEEYGTYKEENYNNKIKEKF